MRLIGKIIILIVIIGVLLGASAYVILFTDEDNTAEDTEPPEIISISGDFTVIAGKTATVLVDFLDNVNVTEATLFFKSATAANWMELSILNGSAHINIPSGTTNNYYYYVTVNDAAGNGPVGDPSVNGSSYYTITVVPEDEDNDDFTHTVFIEEATATWCSNCPNVAKILHDLYETQSYDFYYISLINDSSSKVWDHLKNGYNIYAFPTTYIDGGYRVILGGNKPQSDFIDAITAAQSRTVPLIKISLTAHYNNATEKVTVNATVQNKGEAQYTGELKIYLTEIVSHLNGYDSKPYQFGFLDYVLIKDISIDGQSSDTFTQSSDISAYDYENLMIIGVVFSSEAHTSYSQPPDQNPFTAYYADATDAATIVEGGNLPPQLEITSPQKGKIYLNGNPILEKILAIQIFGYPLGVRLHNTTKLYGEKVITVSASDDTGIAKVEFYIDGTLQYNDTEAPYEWSFKKINKIRSIFMKTHVLEVKVYDDAGKQSSAILEFKARI
jgi:hypothetical protein